MKKIATLLIAITGLVGTSLAQYNAVWNSQYQHSTNAGFSNEARRIVEDASGNIFEMLDATSDIDPTGLHGGLWHYMVLNKYSGTGTLLNTINVNVQKHVSSGFNNLGAFGLEVDASGNIYTGYITWNSITSFDVVLSKYNNNLVRQWANSYGGNGDETGVEMKVNASGTIYALVKSVTGSASYSIIKSVNSSSPAVHIYTYVTGSAVLNTLALDAGARAYVGGYSLKGGHKNAYVGCVNVVTGTLGWNSIYTPTAYLGDDEINKIVVGADGNIYSAGYSFQGGNLGYQALSLRNLANNPRFDYIVLLGTTGTYDNAVQINAAEVGWIYLGTISGVQAVVYRFPATGIFNTASKVTFAPAPASAYNSIDAITLNSMKVSAAKNIYVTGGVTATDNQGQFVSCYFEKASVVFGNALVKVGSMAVQGSYDHNLEGIDLALDYAKADVYLLRTFWDNAHMAERVELVDVNVPAPLREAYTGNGLSNTEVSLSPNPARNQVNISSEAFMQSIEVMDITGNRILFTTLESNRTTLDVSTLSTGIYFCKIKTEEGELIKRLVIN